MAIWAAAIMGGAALAGDAMSQSGTDSTNQANINVASLNNQWAMQRQTQQEDFNAAQAGISREFSAQQVQQQEEFQKSQQQESERYNTEMSNTAISRRMSDLTNAGINPLLAVGGVGGATAPTIQAMSGASAQGAQASGGIASPGSLPTQQNPAAAFGNLGGQLSNAVEAAKASATIDLLKAQADKANAEAGQEIPAQVQYLKQMTNTSSRQADQAYYNTQLIQEQIYNQRLNNDTFRDITSKLQGQNLEVLLATKDALISASRSDATAKQLGLQKLQNLNDVQSTWLGKFLNWFDQSSGVTNAISSGTQLLHAF